MPRHLISLQDLDDDHLEWMIDRTISHAQRRHPDRTLVDCVVGLHFALTSTRTRTAFATGAARLGAHTVSYGPADLQLNTGESRQDTGHVLAGMLDAFVVRARGGNDELREFAVGKDMAVLNAMSDSEHPTQALADLATMQQRFGRVDGLRVLYLGEANSTTTALCLALGRYPATELHLRTPATYGLPVSVSSAAQSRGALIDERHDLADLPDHVDVVYTTQWQTTGTTKKDENWLEMFAPFTVSERLMALYPAAVFMHDLPAHRGEEVAAAVIDGEQSVVFQQAANKLYSAMAALEWCLSSA